MRISALSAASGLRIEGDDDYRERDTLRAGKPRPNPDLPHTRTISTFHRIDQQSCGPLPIPTPSHPIPALIAPLHRYPVAIASKRTSPDKVVASSNHRAQHPPPTSHSDTTQHRGSRMRQTPATLHQHKPIDTQKVAHQPPRFRLPTGIPPDPAWPFRILHDCMCCDPITGSRGVRSRTSIHTHSTIRRARNCSCAS